MAKKVNMISLATGMMKQGFYGFSWTYLFFGFFVPLFRGELGVAAWSLMSPSERFLKTLKLSQFNAKKVRRNTLKSDSATVSNC
jgi:hypothetical protein